MRSLCALWVLSVIAIACGGGKGGSGVSGSKQVSTLSGAEITDVCEYIVAVLGPERVITCAPDVTITVGGELVADCVDDTEQIAADPTCTITVGQYEGCAEALGAQSDAEICSDGPPPAACTALFACE